MSAQSFLVESYIEGNLPRPAITLTGTPLVCESIVLERADKDVDRSLPSVGELAQRIKSIPIDAIQAVRDFLNKLLSKALEGLKRLGGYAKKAKPSVSVSFSPPAKLEVSLQIPRMRKGRNYFISINLYADLARGKIEVDVKGHVGEHFDFTVSKFTIMDLSNMRSAEDYADDIVDEIEAAEHKYIDDGDDDAFPRMGAVTENEDDLEDMPAGEPEEAPSPLDKFIGQAYVFAAPTNNPKKLMYRQINQDTPAGVTGTPMTREGSKQAKDVIDASREKFVSVFRIKKTYQRSVVVIGSGGRSKNYDENDYDRDKEVLKEIIEPAGGDFVEIESEVLRKAKDPFERTFLLARESARLSQGATTPRMWSGILTRLGISAIVDMGSGFLDARKRYAGLALNRKAVRVMKTIPMSKIKG